ncbi:MAG: hypothetical protein HQK49_15315 [Oligoflexia bacterium]|nr:hypothetical protein [Oligoflexia bacterium]
MLKKIIFLIVSYLFIISAGNILAEDNPNLSVFKYFRTNYPYDDEEKNVTAFNEFFKGTKESVPVKASELKIEFPYKVIMVRGLFTKLYVDIAKIAGTAISLPDGYVDSFYDLKNWLTSLGIENTILPTNTQVGSIVNAEELRDAILTSNKPVLLISHSKGGVDTIYALVNYPEIREKVVGWVSIQSLFYGTKLIDYIVNNPLFSKIISERILEYGGDPKSLYDITSLQTKKFMETNSKEINDILNKIPVVSIGSRFVSPALFSIVPMNSRSILDSTNNILYMSGDVDNDGLVSTIGTCLKGSVCVFLDNFDHTGAVMSLTPFFSISHEERLQFAWSVLNMVTSRIKH